MLFTLLFVGLAGAMLSLYMHRVVTSELDRAVRAAKEAEDAVRRAEEKAEQQSAVEKAQRNEEKRNGTEQQRKDK
jgi:Tfp pilus assembly protein PilX